MGTIYLSAPNYTVGNIHYSRFPRQHIHPLVRLQHIFEIRYLLFHSSMTEFQELTQEQLSELFGGDNDSLTTSHTQPRPQPAVGGLPMPSTVDPVPSVYLEAPASASQAASVPPLAVQCQLGGYMVYRPLDSWGTRKKFKYNMYGELLEEIKFDRASLHEYIYSHPLGKKLIIWIQTMPHNSQSLYSERNGSCRAADCDSICNGVNGHIDIGHYRIAFDELYGRDRNHVANPWSYAALLHVHCFERLINSADIVRNCNFQPDFRTEVNKEIGSVTMCKNFQQLERRKVLPNCENWILNAKRDPDWEARNHNETLNGALWLGKVLLRPHRARNLDVPGARLVSFPEADRLPRPVKNFGWGGRRRKGVTLAEMKASELKERAIIYPSEGGERPLSPARPTNFTALQRTAAKRGMEYDEGQSSAAKRARLSTARGHSPDILDSIAVRTPSSSQPTFSADTVTPKSGTQVVSLLTPPYTHAALYADTQKHAQVGNFYTPSNPHANFYGQPSTPATDCQPVGYTSMQYTYSTLGQPQRPMYVSPVNYMQNTQMISVTPASAPVQGIFHSTTPQQSISYPIQPQTSDGPIQQPLDFTSVPETYSTAKQQSLSFAPIQVIYSDNSLEAPEVELPSATDQIMSEVAPAPDDVFGFLFDLPLDEEWLNNLDDLFNINHEEKRDLSQPGNGRSENYNDREP